MTKFSSFEKYEKIELVMRYCNGCGEKMRSESTFCPSCGFKQLRTTKKLEAEDIHPIKDTIPIFDNKPIEGIKSESENKNSSYQFLFIIGGLIIISLIIVWSVNQPKVYSSTALAIDSVAVDTLPGNQEVGNYQASAVDSVSPSFSRVDSSNVSQSFNTTDFSSEEYAKGKLDEFMAASISEDYEKFYDLFSERTSFHNLPDATIPQIIKEAKNYKKRWQVVDENYISISNEVVTRTTSVFKYEKTLQLKRNPDNGKLYNYHIIGNVSFDLITGKIFSIKDESTIKEN